MADNTISPIGPLPEGWRLVPLGDLATHIGSGATPRGGSKVYLEGRINYAIVRSQNVYDRRFDATRLAFIADEHAAELRGVELEPDDVLINITGDGVTFGRACLVPSEILPACVNQHVIRIRCDQDRCIPGYLVSFLTHPIVKSYIESFNAGGSRRAITKGHVESFEVPLPPLDIQRAIADILGSLDDKIELNRRMNQTLEAMARAIFRSWFIDFDPVRAKVDGNPPPGLDPATAALFPDAFQDSPLGPIPQGWDVAKVNELASLSKQSVDPSDHPDEVFDHYSIPAFDNGQTPASDAGETIKSNKFLVSPDSVLLSKLNPRISRVWLPVLASDRRSICSTEFLDMRPSNRATREFLYCMFTSRPFNDVYATLVTGTSGSHQRVKPQNLLDLEVLAPPFSLISAFTEIVKPIFDRIAVNRSEQAALAATRDALLPRLLSGEFHARRVEAIAASTTG